MSKYKIGDVFTKKNTRDSVPLKIISITHNVWEDDYKLKPVKFCGEEKILSESALETLYNKV